MSHLTMKAARQVIEAHAAKASTWARRFSVIPLLGSQLSRTKVDAQIIDLAGDLVALSGRSLEFRDLVPYKSLSLMGGNIGRSLALGVTSALPDFGILTSGIAEDAAAMIVRVSGWAIFLMLQDGKDIRVLSSEETKAYLERGRSYAEAILVES